MCEVRGLASFFCPFCWTAYPKEVIAAAKYVKAPLPSDDSWNSWFASCATVPTGAAPSAAVAPKAASSPKAPGASPVSPAQCGQTGVGTTPAASPIQPAVPVFAASPAASPIQPAVPVFAGPFNLDGLAAPPGTPIAFSNSPGIAEAPQPTQPAMPSGTPAPPAREAAGAAAAAAAATGATKVSKKAVPVCPSSEARAVKFACARPGCSNPSWNDEEKEYCSKLCKDQHAASQQAQSAGSDSAMDTDSSGGVGDNPWKALIEAGPSHAPPAAAAACEKGESGAAPVLPVPLFKVVDAPGSLSHKNRSDRAAAKAAVEGVADTPFGDPQQYQQFCSRIGKEAWYSLPKGGASSEVQALEETNAESMDEDLDQSLFPLPASGTGQTASSSTASGTGQNATSATGAATTPKRAVRSIEVCPPRPPPPEVPPFLV